MQSPMALDCRAPSRALAMTAEASVTYASGLDAIKSPASALPISSRVAATP